MSSMDSILFNRAKEILREHHNNFSELKIHVCRMLMDDLGMDEPGDDLVSWVSYIIRSEDWKSFSTQRIRDFQWGDGKDFIDWMSITIMRDDPDDSWFKPYVEKEELTEAKTLAGKLTVGMRGSYWLEDADKAQSCLKSAIEELKETCFEPEKDFLFVDYYLEMVNNGRYEECSDLITVLHNIALDDLSKERVLAQSIGVSMRCGRVDITQLAAGMAMELEVLQRDVLPFNLACYYATAGEDEERMYDFIQLAVKNGKSAHDFNDSDFDSHRHKIMFKVLTHGGTREQAEAEMQAVGSLDAPQTLDEAISLISRLRAVADSMNPRSSCDENVISKYFGTPCESFGSPAEVPLLDDVLKNFGHLLPEKSLVDLFVIAFYSMEANYQVALDAVGRLADSESQMQIADAFMKAGTYYDAGHRAEDNTVHDQLIESTFPHFNDDALIYLLEICDTQYLAADEMHHLFVDVLQNEKTTDDMKKRVYERFLMYYEKEGADSDYYNDQFQNLFRDLLPLLPDDVKAKIKKLKGIDDSNSAEIMIHCKNCASRFINVLHNYQYAGSLKNDTVLTIYADPEKNLLSFHMFDGADGELVETHQEELELCLGAGDTVEMYVIEDKLVRELLSDGSCEDRTETGSARTLIPPECDYSVYAYYSEASLGYFCIGFYPDGKAISINTSAVKAPHRFEPRKWFELLNSAMEWSYSLCSGSEQKDGIKQGDKLTVTIWGIHYTGSLNENGELVLTTTVDGKELNYVYKYMGCVKGDQFIFG